jgi:hypothetical protein
MRCGDKSSVAGGKVVSSALFAVQSLNAKATKKGREDRKERQKFDRFTTCTDVQLIKSTIRIYIYGN